jgi:hypothetical protein
MSNINYNPNEDKPFADATSENERMLRAGDMLKKFADMMSIHSEYFEFKPLFIFCLLIGLVANVISLLSGGYALYLITSYFRSEALAILSGVVGMLAIEGFYGFFLFKYFKFRFSNDYRSTSLGIAAVVAAILSCALNLYGSEHFFNQKDENLNVSLIVKKPQIHDLDSVKRVFEAKNGGFFVPPYALDSLQIVHQKQVENFKRDKSNFGLGRFSDILLPDASKRLDALLQKQSDEISFFKTENDKAQKSFEKRQAQLKSELDAKIIEYKAANDAYAQSIIDKTQKSNDKNRGFAFYGLLVLEIVKIACYYFCLSFMYRSSKQAVKYKTIPEPIKKWGYDANMIANMAGQDIVGLQTLYINSQAAVLANVQRIALLQIAHKKGFCKHCNKMLIKEQITSPNAEFCSDLCSEEWQKAQTNTANPPVI